MNLRRQRSEEPEVNLTPLIDVVFLLLLFFMISTTFQKEAELRIDLPEASAEPGTDVTKKLEVTIDIGGRFFVNGQEVVNRDEGTLKRAIRSIVKGKTDVPVVIRADALTPHQAVVTAMDVAGQLGLNHISLATSHSGSSK